MDYWGACDHYYWGVHVLAWAKKEKRLNEVQLYHKILQLNTKKTCPWASFLNI
ncbi:hypothetical protein GCM10007096_27520 [Pullulanibacillus pueri]|uniref:Uncharacterized protein n=1 Tax=Pullulanibacillus pueri TaxID=1437324 RepID=A0A8J2ZXG9_9BACL|nr:hypothetical protein GCM10007096_27520 [Pullulanibacillus pueri]